MMLRLNALIQKSKFSKKRLYIVLSACILLINFSAVKAKAENGKIAYSHSNAIYKMNPIGTNVQQLTFATSNEKDFSPVWSPDGSKIAFVRFVRDAGVFHIYTIDSQGGNLTEIKNSTSFLNDLAWSYDGQKLAYVEGGDTTFEGRYYNSSCGGGSVIRVIQAVPNGYNYNVYTPVGATDPVWAPEGNKIYYVRNTNSQDYGLYSINLLSSFSTRLTYDSLPPADPAVSPDGSKIAYAVGYPEQGNCFAGNMSTMEPQISYNYSAGDIVVRDIWQGTYSVLVSNGAMPAWKPNGDYVLFLSTRDASGLDGMSPELHTITVEGQNPVRIPNFHSYEASGSWSP
jgi:TolB protein